MKNAFKTQIHAIFSLLLSTALVVLVASCAPFESSKKGSLTFSFGPSVIKAVASSARDVTDDIVSEDDELDSLLDTLNNLDITKAEIVVSLSGDYKRTQTLDITKYVAAVESEDELPNITETLTFTDIPVGSRVVAQGDVYVTVSLTDEILAQIQSMYDTLNEQYTYLKEELTQMQESVSEEEGEWYEQEVAYFKESLTEYETQLAEIKKILDEGGTTEHVMTGTSDTVTIGSEDNIAVISLKTIEDEPDAPDEPSDTEIPYTVTLTYDSSDNASRTLSSFSLYSISDTETVASILSLSADDFDENAAAIKRLVLSGSSIQSYSADSDEVSIASDGTITITDTTTAVSAGESRCFIGVAYFEDGTVALAHPGSEKTIGVSECFVTISETENNIALVLTAWNVSGETTSHTYKIYFWLQDADSTREDGYTYTCDESLTETGTFSSWTEFFEIIDGYKGTYKNGLLYNEYQNSGAFDEEDIYEYAMYFSTPISYTVNYRTASDENATDYEEVEDLKKTGTTVADLSIIPFAEQFSTETIEGYTYYGYNYEFGEDGNLTLNLTYISEGGSEEEEKAFLTEVTLSQISASLSVDEQTVLTALGVYSDGTSSALTSDYSISAASSEQSVAIVNTNSDGEITITGIGSGEAIITVTVTSKSDSELSFEVTCEVIVSSTPATTISLSYASGSTVPSASLYEVTFYGVPSSSLTTTQLAALASGKYGVVDFMKLLKDSSAVYLGQYYGAGNSSLSVDSSTGAITIEASTSFTSDGTSVYPVALVEYGSTANSSTTISAFAFAYGTSPSEISATEGEVSFTNLTTSSIPCEVIFLNKDNNNTINDEYTTVVALDSYTIGDETMIATVKKSATSRISALIEAGYSLVENDGTKGGVDRYVSANKSYTGFPYVGFYYAAAERNDPATSGISVTLDETSFADEGKNVTVTVEQEENSITFTAVPAAGASAGYAYQWYLDGEALNGATTSSYELTEYHLAELDADIHYIMLDVTISGAHYSAQTTFTITK